MPPTLIENITDDAALSEAGRIASRYIGSETESAEMADFQGMSSKTVLVTLQGNDSGRRWIVQFRDTEVDVTKVALARSKLGPIVPDTHRAHSDISYFAYISNFISGELWMYRAVPYMELPHETSASISRELAGLLAQCTLTGESSAPMVDSYIRPRLRHIIKWEFTETQNKELRDKIQRLVDGLDIIKCLPLGVIHGDVNDMNVILDEDNNIVGLIDWELTTILPLGINLGFIRRMATDNRNRTEYEAPRTEIMAEAWWDGFVAKLPDELQTAEIYNALVVIMQVGAVMNFFWEGCEGLSQHQMGQCLENLVWLEKIYRVKCEAECAMLISTKS